MTSGRDARLVLLVEDNPHDEVLALRALKRSGLPCEVAVVRDGAEAFSWLTGGGGGGEDRPLPALVILDLKLPKVDGIEVLRRIRGEERLRVLPVVVFTSSDEERDRRESYRAGANSYVRKPIEFERYRDAVQEIGRYWLLRNDPPGR